MAISDLQSREHIPVDEAEVLSRIGLFVGDNVLDLSTGADDSDPSLLHTSTGAGDTLRQVYVTGGEEASQQRHLRHGEGPDHLP